MAYTVRLTTHDKWDIEQAKKVCLPYRPSSIKVEPEPGNPSAQMMVEFDSRSIAIEVEKQLNRQMRGCNACVYVGWQSIWGNAESRITQKLARELNGQMGVRTPAGNIDILTSTSVIEVKKFKDWKHAIGQVSAYSQYYPDHQKQIYLFDRETPSRLTEVQQECRKQGIEAYFVLDEGAQ